MHQSMNPSSSDNTHIPDLICNRPLPIALLGVESTQEEGNENVDKHLCCECNPVPYTDLEGPHGQVPELFEPRGAILPYLFSSEMMIFCFAYIKSCFLIMIMIIVMGSIIQIKDIDV